MINFLRWLFGFPKIEKKVEESLDDKIDWKKTSRTKQYEGVKRNGYLADEFMVWDSSKVNRGNKDEPSQHVKPKNYNDTLMNDLTDPANLLNPFNPLSPFSIWGYDDSNNSSKQSSNDESNTTQHPESNHSSSSDYGSSSSSSSSDYSSGSDYSSSSSDSSSSD